MFSVSCRTGRYDLGFFWHLFINLMKCLDNSVKRTSVVIIVVAVKKFSILTS